MFTQSGQVHDASPARAGHSRWVAPSLLLVLFLVMFSPAPASGEGPGAADAYDGGLRAFQSDDYAGALRLWTPLAEQGDPRAQFGLGLIYQAGLGGTAPDEEAALGWYRRAARSGFSPAQNKLALMYAEGRVIPRDLELAVSLWRQAASAGYGPAQLHLARALEAGSGVERNEREAAEWRARAKSGRPEPGSPPPKPSPPAPPADAFYVQLASLRSHDAAVRSGQEFSRLQPDLLARWQPTVRTVDLGEKGVWHRVLFGPIQGRKQAAALCAQIQARVGPCLVAPAP